MALLLNAAKQARTATARALVAAQTGRGLSTAAAGTAKASGFPCAGARERALVTVDPPVPMAPPQLGSPAKASAFPYAGAAGGSSLVTLDQVPKALRFGPTSMAGAGAPAPVVAANNQPMALLLNAAKQARIATARALVAAQTGRGLSSAGTAKASGFPCAGARERALVTLDLVPKALQFGSRPVAPPGAKASAFPYAGAAGGSSLDMVPKALLFGAGAPVVVAADKAGSGSVEGMAGKAAPSLVKKKAKAAAITAGVRSYVTRGGRCWAPCQATPEAWDDQEKAIAAHIRKMEEALGKQISDCLAGNRTLSEQIRKTCRRVVLIVAGAIAFAVGSGFLGIDLGLRLIKRRLLDFLDCPELFAILRRHQGEAQNQLLEFSQETEARELRRALATEVWDAAVKDIFTARSVREMIGSLFGSNKGADKKKSPVAVASAGAAGGNKD